jgi:CRISPR system Cascade subunit CasB
MKLNKLSGQDVECLRTWCGWLDRNRGDRAQLRRAQSPEDILLSPAFSHFLNHMPRTWVTDNKFPLTDIAMVAAVLARVKDEPPDKSMTFATALAAPKKGSLSPIMSELRFQQLQKSRTPQDFYLRICRAVQLLGGKVNIVCLADDILHWLAEYRYGPASKPDQRLAVRWATDYYTSFKE